MQEIFVPSYEFRNYLFRLGVIKYTDFPKIHEDPQNPQNQIISLTHLLERSRHSEFYGKGYIEIAEKLYNSWRASRKEAKLRAIIKIRQTSQLRMLFSKFYSWANVLKVKGYDDQFRKLREYITRLLRENKELQGQQVEAYHSPNQSKQMQWSHENSQRSTFRQSDSFHQYPLKDNVPFTESLIRTHQTSAQLESEIVSPAQTVKNQFYERLYKEAFHKQEIFKRIKQINDDKELQECTFKPNIGNKPVISTSSVFDRLSHDPRNIKETINKKKREEEETKDCSFVPTINTSKNFSRKPTPERLYKLAEERRQALRHKQAQKEQEQLSTCTFKPHVNTPTRSRPSSSIHDELYNSFRNSQQKKRVKEIQDNADRQRIYTFTPQLVTSPKRSSDIPAYQRLYEDHIKREQKNFERNQEHERSQSSHRVRTRENSPSYFRGRKAVDGGTLSHSNSRGSIASPRHGDLVMNIHKQQRAKKQFLIE